MTMFAKKKKKKISTQEVLSWNEEGKVNLESSSHELMEDV